MLDCNRIMQMIYDFTGKSGCSFVKAVTMQTEMMLYVVLFYSPIIYVVIEGSLRLAHGPSVNQGRVEVYHDGVWGTVCDYQWGIDEADVVCKQLGYSRAISPYAIGGDFGHGTGQVYHA